MRRTVLLLVAALAACACAPEGVMLPISPPANWEPALEAARAFKDRQFRLDPETPLLPEDVAGFEGLDYWPPDPSYRVFGPIEVYPSPERFTIVTSAGEERPCERYGQVTFRLPSGRQSLQVYRLLDEPAIEGAVRLFLPFKDATTGTETYPGGRYVNLQGPPGGPFILDFNTAYNPSCAYGSPERFRCPVTPPENKLGVPIEAGERGFKVKPGREDE